MIPFDPLSSQWNIYSLVISSSSYGQLHTRVMIRRRYSNNDLYHSQNILMISQEDKQIIEQTIETCKDSSPYACMLKRIEWSVQNLIFEHWAIWISIIDIVRFIKGKSIMNWYVSLLAIFLVSLTRARPLNLFREDYIWKRIQAIYWWITS